MAIKYSINVEKFIQKETVTIYFLNNSISRHPPERIATIVAFLKISQPLFYSSIKHKHLLHLCIYCPPFYIFPIAFRIFRKSPPTGGCSLRRVLAWLTENLNDWHMEVEDFYSNSTHKCIEKDSDGTSTEVGHNKPMYFQIT